MQSRRQKSIAEDLVEVLKIAPEASLVENKYRTLRITLKRSNPILETLDKDVVIKLLKDAIYLDRKLRQLTEGMQEKLKKQLSEEKMVELGYFPEPQKELFNDKIST